MCRTFIYIAISFALGIAFGWWLGTRKEPIEVVREEVRFIKGDTTTVYVDRPIAKYIYVRDTIIVREEKRIPIPADTAAIIADYQKQREYDLDFSTDTTGTFKVRAFVSHNRLASASATIAPLQREVLTTTREVRAFRPYLGGGIALGAKAGASLEVGALLKDHHMPRVGYQRLGKDNYLTIGYGYTF